MDNDQVELVRRSGAKGGPWVDWYDEMARKTVIKRLCKRLPLDSLAQRALEAEARADSLASYVSFQQTRESRATTIDSLAKSRFDWERVVRELSRVIPEKVWLSNLTGTVAPEVQLDDGAAIALRASVPGPALELVGCARSQPVIASLIAALHDIDGVTRVTAANGIKTPDTSSGGGGGGGGAQAADTGGSCPRSAPSFQIVAAFDAVAVEGADVPPAAAPDGSEAVASPTGERQAAEEAGAKVNKATNLVPGG